MEQSGVSMSNEALFDDNTQFPSFIRDAPHFCLPRPHQASERTDEAV